jgi:hypothetical protein
MLAARARSASSLPTAVAQATLEAAFSMAASSVDAAQSVRPWLSSMIWA